MKKIMKVIENETSWKSYQTEKYSFDKVNRNVLSYDSESEREVKKGKYFGETVKHRDYISLFNESRMIKDNPPIIKYFLDGSRHVYKVDDIAKNKKVFPVIAGQVGVGCCVRNEKRLKKVIFLRDLIISLPTDVDADGWGTEAVFGETCRKINENELLKKLGLSIKKIIPYSTSNTDVKDDNLENKGIAVIQDYMCEKEKEVVGELVKKNLLGQDSYLLKDGSLEYKDMKSGSVDFRTLRKIKNNYAWVLGVSKSFNPEKAVDWHGQKNAKYIVDLPLYHRTPVVRYDLLNTKGIIEDVEFGVWYIRIREKSKTNTPFDGILKVEKIFMDSERETGLDSDTVDIISCNIINERSPTCYGRDKRWANHLYPVFLTESYVKSQYLSENLFLSLF